jgi:hypothetical protein
MSSPAPAVCVDGLALIGLTMLAVAIAQFSRAE